ncbi:TPA: KR domain-containing protein [Pseudomonas aeruginosa]
MLHVRAGTDLTPYLLLSPVRRARRLVVLCEQPPRLPVEWAGAPLPETLIVDCADCRALAEVLGRLQAEQPITGFIQARPEWTAGRLEEPTSATQVAAARREMHALENFHGLLAGQPLAFFLILGSLSSLLGGGRVSPTRRWSMASPCGFTANAAARDFPASCCWACRPRPSWMVCTRFVNACWAAACSR